jgi:hypothetical protein
MEDFMQVGTKVKWQSQGGGSSTIKRGTIVRVLRQGENPYKVACKEYPNHQLMFDGWGLPGGKNTQTAYLVEVIKSPRAKPRLYLPFPCKVMRD